MLTYYTRISFHIIDHFNNLLSYLLCMHWYCFMFSDFLSCSIHCRHELMEGMKSSFSFHLVGYPIVDLQDMKQTVSGFNCSYSIWKKKILHQICGLIMISDPHSEKTIFIGLLDLCAFKLWSDWCELPNQQLTFSNQKEKRTCTLEYGCTLVGPNPT